MLLRRGLVLQLGCDSSLDFGRRQIILRWRLGTQGYDFSGRRPFRFGDHLRFGDLRLHCRTRKVEDHRGPIELTAREFDLLFHLASYPEQVFSREQLLDAVWDLEFPGDASTVTVSIRRLRSKVETDPSRPRHLKTVWGVGYKFEP